jgi:guanosine-diphosphatase
MRRTSVSLPTTRNVAHDSYEKPARYNPRSPTGRNANTLEKVKAAWMTQSQRSRYLKTGGIILFVAFLFYLFTSRGGTVYNEGKHCFHC